MKTLSSQVRITIVLNAAKSSRKIDFLIDHLGQRNIELWMNQHFSGFTDNSIYVEVSTGEHFEPMRILANEFEPKLDDYELHQFHYLIPDTPGGRTELVTGYGALLGLLGFSVSECKAMCRNHIRKMIENRHYTEHTCGESTSLQHRILLTILKYQGIKKVS